MFNAGYTASKIINVEKRKLGNSGLEVSAPGPG